MLEVKPFEKESLAQLLSEIGKKNLFVISPKKVEKVLQEYDYKTLLQKLVAVASEFAHFELSKFQVGAAGLAESGAIYLGVNLEFKGFPLNQTVHAEQFLLANAISNSEDKLLAIAVSAAPCGHCRQFIQEIGESCRTLEIILPRRTVLFPTLLPESFGPQDLGIEGSMMAARTFISKQKDILIAKATEAAFTSYTPYTKSFSGVSIQSKDGNIYSGSYLENVGFNPSLSPLQTALVNLIASGKSYSEIDKVVLVENEDAAISQKIMTEAIVKSIAKDAKLTYANLCLE